MTTRPSPLTSPGQIEASVEGGIGIVNGSMSLTKNLDDTGGLQLSGAGGVGFRKSLGASVGIDGTVTSW
jgi:hypothetical protein